MSKNDTKKENGSDEQNAVQPEQFQEEVIDRQLVEWQNRANEYLNDLKRTQADFENYKKRMAADRSELTNLLVRGIVSDLVPILDNFHQATLHIPKGAEGSPWVTGITYIEKQFEDVLAGYGVKPLEVKEGDLFDPAKHEAISNEPTSKEEQDAEHAEAHTIMKVVQKGYMIGDKVVRAAKVIVQ